MIALRNNHIDAAVLDVNLGGELIYPLADVLAADHVPFVFITGYGAEEIEPRYAHVPILQKPIEAGALKTVLLRPAAASTSEILRRPTPGGLSRLRAYSIAPTGPSARFAAAASNAASASSRISAVLSAGSVRPKRPGATAWTRMLSCGREPSAAAHI